MRRMLPASPNLLNLERCFQRSIHTPNLFCLFNWQRFRFFLGTKDGDFWTLTPRSPIQTGF